MFSWINDIIYKIAPDSDLSTTFLPPASKFLPEIDMPDLTGKVAVVTGGNAGIGFQTCKQLLLHNCSVILAARSSAKGNEAVDKLKKETGKDDIQFLQLDLGDLKQVRVAAADLLTKVDKIDILFNNAGVMIPPLDQLTTQGYDLQFGTNVIGPYLFTTLVIPALEKAKQGRIINTASSGHNFAPKGDGIEFGVVAGGEERDAFIKKAGTGLGTKFNLYGQSKLGNILVSNQWARELAPKGIVSCSLHPGGIRTELQRHSGSFFEWLSEYLLYPASMGAYTQLYAGTTATPEEINGKYLNPWARIHRSSAQGDNVPFQELLKTWLDEQVAKY
ncbi:NAD(P)-binding protein [Meredithblackwellia eburnea MCA 4105]